MFIFILYFSPNHFQLVDQVVGKEAKKAFDVEKAGKLFRERLFELIKKKFTKTWDELDMKNKLILLEFGKSRTDNDSWRPTRKPVDMQCSSHVIKALSKQKVFLQRQIEFQNQQIAVSMIAVAVVSFSSMKADRLFSIFSSR
jgi:hypothetical protein